jgi:hypothetical protein
LTLCAPPYAVTQRRNVDSGKWLVNGAKTSLPECMENVREQDLRRVAAAQAEVEIETRENHDLSCTDQSVADESSTNVRTLLVLDIEVHHTLDDVGDHLAQPISVRSLFGNVGKCNAGLGHRGVLRFRVTCGKPTLNQNPR